MNSAPEASLSLSLSTKNNISLSLTLSFGFCLFDNQAVPSIKMNGTEEAQRVKFVFELYEPEPSVPPRRRCVEVCHLPKTSKVKCKV